MTHQFIAGDDTDELQCAKCGVMLYELKECYTQAPCRFDEAVNYAQIASDAELGRLVRLVVSGDSDGFIHVDIKGHSKCCADIDTLFATLRSVT
jgi:hypothetical protein